MMGDLSRLRKFMKKFIETVRFGNDHFGAIMGYGDYVIGDSVISRVYYVEGLGHNLFSVRQFCDSDLEVAFRKYSCYVRDSDGVELIKGKSKKHTYKPKTKNTNLEVLNTLHMDLCRPMRVQTINGKKYILVIVDDYSLFTWVKFLRSKDETLESLSIKTRLHIMNVSAIFHQKTVPRTPQQNGVIERQNHTLVEAARTMQIFSKALMFLWAEAVATASGYGGAQNRVGNANPGGQDNAIDEDVDKQPVQDLALNVDKVFQADDCDAFDSDVDEAPTAQTMLMANLSSADPVYDEAGPSYDSDILSEVHDHDHYQDVVCEHHEEHEMHDDVQPTYVVDSHANYMSDSNMIPYDQYVKDNAVPVVKSNVYSVPNDAYMMIFNDMHEPYAQSISDITRNIVVDNSLIVELATYKEQVEQYERWARFELTEREQKIHEQLRIVIIDCNIKEEILKKELHSVKMQLASTINHNKSIEEEVTSLKKDFK
ncbi:integrase, catalytic region, zinc finger, CCHC-type containing protein [Tanacetum coccineum]|uniref:Integrase, catalytic region, zinc finger, CCHC-type containing protein n=1 Tax=Tanacetum coccineum TaxID=301880 RepID=A0ABQ4XP49_9ASTR